MRLRNREVKKGIYRRWEKRVSSLCDYRVKHKIGPRHSHKGQWDLESVTTCARTKNESVTTQKSLLSHDERVRIDVFLFQEEKFNE